MQGVKAVYMGGVLVPARPLDLPEGSPVVFRVDPIVDGTPPELMPDPVIETGEQSAPIDLPLPQEATRVRARPGEVPMPGPPITME